jgi:hypothetical protein
LVKFVVSISSIRIHQQDRSYTNVYILIPEEKMINRY